MAGRLIIIPNWMPAEDAAGRRLSGARMWFYENHTTTSKAVYSSAALSAALPNPVIANSAGVFPLIFGEAGSLYTVSVTTAAGVPLATYEDIRAGDVLNELLLQMLIENGLLGTFSHGEYTAQGGETQINVGEPVIEAGTLSLFRNMVRQRPEQDYTADGTEEITLTDTAVSGDYFYWLHTGGALAPGGPILGGYLGTVGLTVPLIGGANKWGNVQYFTVPPEFLDKLGTRAALEFGIGAALKGSNTWGDGDGTSVQVFLDEPQFLDGVTVRHIDPGTAGPRVTMWHDSATPAPGDDIGIQVWVVNNSSPTPLPVGVGDIRMVLDDNTTGSEDAHFEIRTKVAGVDTLQFVIGAGMVGAGATGGFPGSGKFNAKAYHVDGLQVVGARGATIANATGGTEITTINAILAAMRTHGLIAT